MSRITDIQSKKIQHFFRVLDNNDNFILQPDDFKGVAKKINDLVGLDPEAKEYEHTIVQSYRIFIQILTDLEKHEELEITMVEFEAFFENNLSSVDNDPAPIKGYITRVVYYIFNLFDQNHDKYITIDEYSKMLEIYSIDTSYSRKFFKKLDRNKDDRISKEELAMAFHEYFLSSDPKAPGNWIFGEWDYE